MVKFIFIFIFLISLCHSATVDLESLFIDQVRDYKNKNWSKVFARGHFYRSQYLRNELEIIAAFSPNLFKLEIFSLAEKCQWDLVEEIFSQFKKMEKVKFENLKHSNELRAKIESFRAFKLVSKEKAPETKIPNNKGILFEGIDWSSIDDINDIEVEVEDLCQK